MRRPLTFVSAGFVAVVLMAAGSFVTTSPASAANIAPTTTCNNALGNGGAVCEVTVVNTITSGGGSAAVTVRECTGSAGVPDTACTVTTSVLTSPVTAVTQCNASINGGGGVLRCSVDVINNFVGGSATPTAVTVNQCVGSGESGAIGATIVCDPYPATTTGATITQCNGSGNGGTLVGLICSASGTESAGLTVLINQCNGSTNGGGTLTVCTASITNNNVDAGGTPTPSTGAGSTPAPFPGSGTPAVPFSVTTPGGSPGLPDTSVTAQIVPQGNGTGAVILAGVVLLAALSVMAARRRLPD